MNRALACERRENTSSSPLSIANRSNRLDISACRNLITFPPRRTSLLKYRIAGFTPRHFYHAHLEAWLHLTTPLSRLFIVSNLCPKSERKPLLARKLCLSLPVFVLMLALSISALPQESRHFTFHYAFSVKNLPSATKVHIWIPAAESDAYQEVKVVSAKGDLPLKKSRESKYGNAMYYAETTSTTQPELHFDIEYDVVRRERVALAAPAAKIVSASLTAKDRQQDFGQMPWSRSRAFPPISPSKSRRA